jgi:hypothetical protein
MLRDMADTIEEMRNRARHCRYLAGTLKDLRLKQTLLDAARDLEQESFRLEREANIATQKPSAPCPFPFRERP